MENLLKCSNPECVSHDEDETPYFSISVTVGADCHLSENLHRVEAEHFTCVYCSDPAVSTEDDPPADPGVEAKPDEVKCAHCDEPVWYDDEDGWCHENGEHDCFLAIGKERS